MVGTKQRYATGPSMAPWIVAGVVLVVAVAVIAWMLGRDSSSADPAPVETSSETPSSAPQAANGCLGGTDPTTAILAAQEEAPLTAEGAAAFVATYTRWRFQAPRAVEDLESVGPLIWTDEVPQEERTEAPITPGSTFRASLESQRYQARMVGDDEALVALSYLGYDTEGVYATVQSVGLISVQAVDGVWRIGPQTDAPSEAFGTTDEPTALQAFKADLLRTGTEFIGGC